VSTYRFNAAREAASQGQARLNLTTAHRDARRMNELLREVGDVERSKVYTNEQATRANMESAITRWLPSVSRPGDTVIIYFSGHGGQLADDNGDEADGVEEILVPHDVIGVDTLAVVAREKPESLSSELVQFARRVRDGSIPQDQADALLRRATCISDDVFGHWLQSLAGRKIIVVLDSCFSGGFSASEKGALNQEPALSDRFDFLDGEVSRLKDIGQGNAVMLAAWRVG
jgi:hypothetical protein